jgi:hypothetical protein
VRADIENAQRRIGLHDLKLLRIFIQEIAVSEQEIHGNRPG